MGGWITANWIPLIVGVVVGFLVASGAGCAVLVNILKFVRTWGEISTVLASQVELVDCVEGSAKQVKNAVTAEVERAATPVAEGIRFLTQTLDVEKEKPETPKQFRGRLGRFLLGQALKRAIKSGGSKLSNDGRI